jgi:hypothetical protein
VILTTFLAPPFLRIAFGEPVEPPTKGELSSEQPIVVGKS